MICANDGIFFSHKKQWCANSCYSMIELWIHDAKWKEKNLWSLGLEDPLKKGMAAHSSIFAWEMPWTEENYSPWNHRVKYNLVRLNNSKISKCIQTESKLGLLMVGWGRVWKEIARWMNIGFSLEWWRYFETK